MLVACVTMKKLVMESLTISASSTISRSGPRVAENMSDGVLRVGYQRYESMLIKTRLLSMSNENSARRELVKTLAREKSILFST